jgi:hypothetical protein
MTNTDKIKAGLNATIKAACEDFNTLFSNRASDNTFFHKPKNYDSDFDRIVISKATDLLYETHWDMKDNSKTWTDLDKLAIHNAICMYINSYILATKGGATSDEAHEYAKNFAHEVMKIKQIKKEIK